MNTFFYRKRAGSFDGFVEMMLLTEGLIASYDVKKLQNSIIKKLDKENVVIFNPKVEELIDRTLDWKAYSFLLSIRNYNKEVEDRLNKILNLFGYYISYKTDHKDFSRLTIEPSRPIIINDILEKRNIKYLYHITHNSNVKNIEKIGLAPKGSETRFDHPNDRIYLIHVNDLTNLYLIKNILAKDKKKDINDFTIFRIPVNLQKYNYYLDDTATVPSENITACFVLKNITPKELIKL